MMTSIDPKDNNVMTQKKISGTPFRQTDNSIQYKFGPFTELCL